MGCKKGKNLKVGDKVEIVTTGANMLTAIAVFEKPFKIVEKKVVKGKMDRFTIQSMKKNRTYGRITGFTAKKLKKVM